MTRSAVRRAVLLVSASTLALAGCGSSEPDQAAAPSTPAEAETATTTGPAIVVENGASDDGGDSGTDGDSADGCTDASGGAPTITPGGLDLTALPSACSDEGMILIPVGGEPEPALEGNPGALTYVGMTEGSGDGATDTAMFSIDSGSGPVEFGPVQLGDQFTLDGVPYSVTSICPEAAELDAIG